jgi:transcriptional regulator GlxA family with amidase domain
MWRDWPGATLFARYAPRFSTAIQKKHLRPSIYAAITRMRAEYIKRILLDMDDSLTAVAEACGFDNASHSTRLFRRATGLTPSEYRTRHRV